MSRTLFSHIINKKLLAASYGAIFLCSLFETFLPGYFPFVADGEKGFFVSTFTIIFLFRLFDKKVSKESDGKIFILLVLLALPEIYLTFISLFFFFYVNGRDYNRMFIVLFFALLKVSLVVEEEIIYTSLVLLFFSGFKEDGIEDTSIKAYTAVFFLGMIDNTMIVDIAITIGAIKTVLLLIQAFGQDDISIFSKKVMSSCLSFFFLCEMITDSGALSHIITTLVMLSVLLESIAVKYILVVPEESQKAVRMRSLLGNKNFTIFFISILIFAPLNPVFNGILHYLSLVGTSETSFYGMISFTFALMLFILPKLALFAERIESSKIPLPDWIQFFLLGTPLGISVFFIPKNAAVGIFFMLSFFYLFFLALITYLKESIHNYVLKEESRIILTIKNLFDNIGHTWSRCFGQFTQGQYACQKTLHGCAVGTIKLICKSFSSIESKNRHELDPSIGLASFFILLLLVTYYEYSL